MLLTRGADNDDEERGWRARGRVTKWAKWGSHEGRKAVMELEAGRMDRRSERRPATRSDGSADSNCPTRGTTPARTAGLGQGGGRGATGHRIQARSSRLLVFLLSASPRLSNFPSSSLSPFPYQPPSAFLPFSHP
eukprot:2148350-Pyramimonas_sp.AAC.1